MGRSGGLIVATALALSACATPPQWSERVTVAVDRGGRELAAFSVPGLSSPPMRNVDDLMLCVVDMDGAARCHHRDGIVSASVAATAASATCPGADAVLRSPCRAGEGCRFSSVAVPSSTFAMMIVELRAPRFGVPRHVVSDAAVVSRPRGSSTPKGSGSSNACERSRDVSRPTRGTALVWRSWTAAPARTPSANSIGLA
jgi:hypothetical protein